MNSGNSKEAVRQAFAKRFCLALVEQGYSLNEQTRLQQLFGVSGQAVRKWIEGQALPTSSRIPVLAKLLGVRRAWLQDGEGPMRELVAVVVAGEDVVYNSAGSEKIALTEAEFKMLRQYRKLSPRQRDMTVELISVLNEDS